MGFRRKWSTFKNEIFIPHSPALAEPCAVGASMHSATIIDQIESELGAERQSAVTVAPLQRSDAHCI